VATNAVLEGKGARVALLVTEGYKQTLQVRRSGVPGGLAGWLGYDHAFSEMQHIDFFPGSFGPNLSLLPHLTWSVALEFAITLIVHPKILDNRSSGSYV
jgi:hypothetical protein